MGRTARAAGAWARRAPVRRWPWAAAAVVAGAAVGGGVAYVVRRVQGEDQPGAVDPASLQAVVDRPQDLPAPGTAPAD